MPAWKRHTNISDLPRNVCVSRKRPGRRRNGKSWRKWPPPGTSWPRTRRLTLWDEFSCLRAARRSSGRPIAATLAPSAAERRALADPGWNSPCPSTLWRSADTLLLSPWGRAPFARLLQRGRRWDVPSTWDVSWGRVAFPSQGQIRRSGARVAGRGSHAPWNRGNPEGLPRVEPATREPPCSPSRA
jgi:hypothetical protein